MKKQITLKTHKVTPQLFSHLEKLKLIKLWIPHARVLNSKTKTGAVSKLYSSNPKFGTHALMCVGKRTKHIHLSYHDDNEDFMILNPLKIKYNKLFLIVAFDKKHKFLKKFLNGKIAREDLIAIELKFNDPLLSFFTMLKGTIHCEVTENKENGNHPVFFVSEPSHLKDNKLSSSLYDIFLEKQ
ncbi:MAG: hypothetical protein LBU55_03480 [Elusimicrobiota bacterium]|jgi:hypothetical protein|nr:hypothetical protein [Elusimicrobiota bacterium]